MLNDRRVIANHRRNAPAALKWIVPRHEAIRGISVQHAAGLRAASESAGPFRRGGPRRIFNLNPRQSRASICGSWLIVRSRSFAGWVFNFAAVTFPPCLATLAVWVRQIMDMRQLELLFWLCRTFRVSERERRPQSTIGAAGRKARG